MERTPSIGIKEAASDLLDAYDRDQRTVAYRQDLWDALRACRGAEFAQTRKLVIRRKADGLFFRVGFDCPDTWVSHPEAASDVDGILYRRDVMAHVRPKDAASVEIVEVELSWRLTGRSDKELYGTNGELMPEYRGLCDDDED